MINVLHIGPGAPATTPGGYVPAARAALGIVDTGENRLHIGATALIVGHRRLVGVWAVRQVTERFGDGWRINFRALANLLDDPHAECLSSPFLGSHSHRLLRVAAALAVGRPIVELGDTIAGFDGPTIGLLLRVFAYVGGVLPDHALYSTDDMGQVQVTHDTMTVITTLDGSRAADPRFGPPAGQGM